MNVTLKAIEHPSWTEAGQEVIGGDWPFFKAERACSTGWEGEDSQTQAGIREAVAAVDPARDEKGLTRSGGRGDREEGPSLRDVAGSTPDGTQ